MPVAHLVDQGVGNESVVVSLADSSAPLIHCNSDTQQTRGGTRGFAWSLCRISLKDGLNVSYSYRSVCWQPHIAGHFQAMARLRFCGVALPAPQDPGSATP